SVPQKGSTFHFTLPLAAAPDSPKVALEARHQQLGDRSVFIIDDNATNCRILSGHATKWGMIARSAQTGEQALEALRGGEKFDVAVIDLRLSGMDGLQLAAEIRKLRKTG